MVFGKLGSLGLNPREYDLPLYDHIINAVVDGALDSLLHKF